MDDENETMRRAIEEMLKRMDEEGRRNMLAAPYEQATAGNFVE